MEAEQAEPFLREAVGTISQADPIVKLLQQVKLGRMKPSDPGLRAIAESWLATYERVLSHAPAVGRAALLRLDPAPRLQLLIDVGILPDTHPAIQSLRAVFQRALVGTRTPSAS